MHRFFSQLSFKSEPASLGCAGGEGASGSSGGAEMGLARAALGAGWLGWFMPAEGFDHEVTV